MNILIVGLGSIGRKHVNAIFQICPNAIIYALRSKSSINNMDNVINIYSLDEIKFQINFIIISNVSAFHEKTIQEMLSYNCTLFIEKPVLINLQNVEKISKELEINKIRTYVACNLRFHPAINFIKQYLKDKKSQINEVNIYCGSYLPNWRPGVDFRKNYSSSKLLGGGVHLDLIHEIDYCTWLFGFPEKYSAIKRSVSSLQIEVYDFANYSLIYKNFVATITLNYYRKDSKREIEIITNNETILIDILNNCIIEKGSNKNIFDGRNQTIDTYYSQMKYFIENLYNDKIFMNNFDYATQVLKIAISE